MSTLKELIDRNKSRRKSQAKSDIVELIEALMTANEMLHMIQEMLQRLGVDTDATPMMFYPEAIGGLIHDKLKEVGAFPGTPATVKYVKVRRKKEKDPKFERMIAAMPQAYRRVELKGKNDANNNGTDANVAKRDGANNAGRSRRKRQRRRAS